eukprot:1722504-Prymnesium_polylepis.1
MGSAEQQLESVRARDARRIKGGVRAVAHLCARAAFAVCVCVTGLRGGRTRTVCVCVCVCVLTPSAVGWAAAVSRRPGE